MFVSLAVIHQQMHPGACCALLARLEMPGLNSLRGRGWLHIVLCVLWWWGGLRCNAFVVQVRVFSG